MQPTGKSYWLKSGFYTIMERVSVLIFGLGSLLILTRALTEEQLGTWVLFLTVTTLIEVGRAGLQQHALVKYLTTSKGDEYGRISTASLFNILVLTAILVIFFIAIAHPISIFWKAAELKSMFFIYTITTVALIPMYQFNFTQQANLDFRGIFWSAATKQGLFFFYVFFCFIVAVEAFKVF